MGENCSFVHLPTHIMEVQGSLLKQDMAGPCQAIRHNCSLTSTMKKKTYSQSTV
jgi:hypothetical protein